MASRGIDRCPAQVPAWQHRRAVQRGSHEAQVDQEAAPHVSGFRGSAGWGLWSTEARSFVGIGTLTAVPDSLPDDLHLLTRFIDVETVSHLVIIEFHETPPLDHTSKLNVQTLPFTATNL